MYKRIFTILAALLATSAVLAQAYRWVDEDGVLHFSDRPHEGAEQFELPTFRAPSGPPPPAPGSLFSTRTSADTAEQEEAPAAYESLNVVSPAAEETLWNIESVLTVTLSVQPGLKQGHRFRVHLDGAANTETRSTLLQINEVYRGIHTIQAEVVDAAGNLMIRSQPNRFYVQQNAIGKFP
jgi:hypothetical protein